MTKLEKLIQSYGFNEFQISDFEIKINDHRVSKYFYIKIPHNALVKIKDCFDDVNTILSRMATN